MGPGLGPGPARPRPSCAPPVRRGVQAQAQGPGTGAHIMIYLCDLNELLIIYELFIHYLFNI